MRTKTCKRCATEYPATEEYFYKCKTTKDKFRTNCKTCHNEETKEWIASNGNKRKRTLKKYRESNVEKIKQYKMQYAQSNKDKIKKYRHSNKALISEISKRYRDKNKLKYAMFAQKRRSRGRKLLNLFSPGQWRECKDYFGGVCAYCGSNKQLTQDHFIALGQGGEYTRNNIIPCCKSCNSSKSTKNFFEWHPKQPFHSKQAEYKILKYLNYDPITKYQQLAL